MEVYMKQHTPTGRHGLIMFAISNLRPTGAEETETWHHNAHPGWVSRLIRVHHLLTFGGLLKVEIEAPGRLGFVYIHAAGDLGWSPMPLLGARPRLSYHETIADHTSCFSSMLRAEAAAAGGGL